MRLTLRTLLAYLDGVLTPEQEADLKAQIESSELASELVHRTGDVVRRPQVGAPEILGLGPVDDPNTMAEYLDGTLPDENVPDFERACLESEVLLAEAASVHRVLKEVLDGNIVVDSDTQRRMQSLPANLQALLQSKSEELQGADDTKVEEILDEPLATNSAEVPDYLKAGKGSTNELMRWAPAIASLLLLAVTAWIVFGRAGSEVNDTVAQKNDDQAVEQQSDENQEESTNSTDNEKIEPQDSGDEQESENPTESAASTKEGASPTESDMEVDDTNGSPSELPEDGKPAIATTTVPEVNSTNTTDKIPPDSSTGQPMQPEGDDSVDPDAVVGDSTDSDSSIDAVESDPEAEPEPATEPIKLVYRGGGSTLMVIADDDDTWHRIADKEEIQLDRRIISLPTYVNPIDLGDSLRLQLIDLSEVILREKQDQQFPTIALEYGNFLLQNIDEEKPALIELEIDGTLCKITLEAGEPLAIEIHRPFTPGIDLVNQSPQLETSIHAKGGNVTWEANGSSYRASQAKQWELTSKGEPSDPRDYESDPEWLSGINNNAWDRRASPQLPKRVVSGEEVWPQLRTIVDSDLYKEVRALAAHCSLAVGHPDPVISSFDDEAQQVSWARNLKKLRMLASHNRLEAEQIRQTLEEQYGEQLSGDMFVMLCGFSADQIGRTRNEFERGEVNQLIEWLESDSLACRVFAMLNLEEVTGRVGIFDATASGTRRRQDVRKIRKQLKENELRLDGADS